MFNRRTAKATLAGILALAIAGSSSEAGAKYKTTYKSTGGAPVNALVDIDGDSGTYTLDNGQQGTLSNLQLFSLGGQNVLKGNWSFQGVNGTIAWKMDGTLDTMDGTWKSGGMTGFWNGTYAGGSGTIGNMGPRKIP
jgi:hypothetical protein